MPTFLGGVTLDGSLLSPGGENCQKLTQKKEVRMIDTIILNNDKWTLAGRFELVTRVNHIKCALASWNLVYFWLINSFEHIYGFSLGLNL